MKIAITIELDKEAAEVFQIPFKKLSKQINDLIGMFEKVDYVIEEAPALEPKPAIEPKLELEPKPVPTKSASKKPKKKSKPQRLVRATILKTITKNKDGINTKDLQQQTGLTGKQISANMFHLKKDKKVEKTKEGLFIAL